MYGSLKDYLIECKEVVRKLNHTPRVMGFRRSLRLRSSVSSCNPAQRGEKLPLSQQSSVFSDISLTSRTNSVSADSEMALSTAGMMRARCLTQDSGFCGDLMKCDTPAASTPDQLTHDYINCKGLLYMEDVMNFAYQIACGLQHLENLGVQL